MKPSGQPKELKLELWGRSIKVATTFDLGRIRLEVVTLILFSLEDKKSKLEEDYQPRLGLSGGGLSF